MAARTRPGRRCSSVHGALVHRVAYRLTLSADEAEDIVQEVFVGLPEARGAYDGLTISLSLRCHSIASGMACSKLLRRSIHILMRISRKAGRQCRYESLAQERVTVPAGTFDCWKVSLGEPGMESFMWVSTANHLVVRSQTIYRFGDTEFDDRVDLQSVASPPQ